MSVREIDARRPKYMPSVNPTAQKGRIELGIEDAVADANWLRESDNALYELCVNYAKLIDSPDGYFTVKLGPHLLEALKEMLFTPRARKEILGTEKPTTGKLAEMRGQRGA